MNGLYVASGTTRQAHYALRKRIQAMDDDFLLLTAILMEERQKHPSMSLKKLYHKIKPDFIGRDAFIDFAMENGFEPIFTYKKPSLTRSGDLRAHPNLLYDMKIFDINQVWVSDTTYIKVNGQWNYITFVEDLYSRRIIGYCASQRLFTSANLEALRMAANTRQCFQFSHTLIHHSDRGSQYRSEEYAKLLNTLEIKISMGYSCFDNAYMESANNIIKNEYLIHRNIRSLQDLQSFLKQDVDLYNNERPHGSLSLMTPCEFERYIFNIPTSQRTLLPIFTDKSKKNKLLYIYPDSQQLKFDFYRNSSR